VFIVSAGIAVVSSFAFGNWPHKVVNTLRTQFSEQPVKAATDVNVQLSAGLGYSVILKVDGTVWTFGRNDAGQLGQNDKLDRSAPTRIDPAYFNNEKVVKVEATAMKTIALTESNNVYSWGEGATKPVKIYSSSLPVVDIEIGGSTDVNTHTAHHIVLNDGRVASTGSNYQAQFGNGLRGYGSAGTCTTSYTTASDNFTQYALTNAIFETCSNNSSLKKIVNGTESYLTDIVDISQNPNKRFLLGLNKSNTLYIWGEEKTDFATPLPNSLNLSISKFEAGLYPTILTSSGELYYYPSISSDPVKIELENSSEKIVDIKSGENNLLILGESGKLYAIGPNNYGQIGNTIPYSGVSWNTKIASYTGISNIINMGVGVEHTILQTGEDKFITLGRNSYGQLATTDINSKTTFQKITSINNVKDIGAPLYSSFAITNANKFYSWGGRNNNERLNREGAANEPHLVQDYSSFGNITALHTDAVSFIHGDLLFDNGTVWTFGHPSYYSLGNPAYNGYGPYELKNLNKNLADKTFNIVSSSLGNFTGVALTSDNKVYTWGYDTNYMLGLGYQVTAISAGVPVTGQLPAFNEAIIDKDQTYKEVYAGYNKKFLLTTDGKVYAWGDNGYNQLGLSDSAKVPTLVNTLPPIEQISLGTYHTLFLDYEGNVWAAGLNSQGQLGIGNTSTPSIPTKIPLLSNVKYIDAGAYSSYAILNNGDLYSFGDNRYGQLGLGDLIQRNEPRKVEGLVNPIKIKGGLKHALVLDNSGEVFVTGSDSDGQLGLGQSQINSAPITVSFPPNVSINTSDNKIYSSTDTLEVTGSVFSETQGVPITLSYTIESKNGKESKVFKSYTSGSSSELYSFAVPLSGYDAGSYTLTIKATTNSGVSGDSAINFTIQDTIKPTISVDITTLPKWVLSLTSVKITSDDAGGSGYRGFRYALTETTDMPTEWSPINPSHNDSIKLDKSGALYLHLQAYDNIGNMTYLRTGPYYLDLSPPEFTFSEPAKWQQNELNLGINIKEASLIKVKKWLPGESTMDEIKKAGASFSSSVPITLNGLYSFYALDENNQETLKTYNVTNINYTPLLHSVPSAILIPVGKKANYSIETSLTHYDANDPIQLLIELNNKIITSKNTNDVVQNNQELNWNADFSSLAENTLFNGQIYLKDSRGGSSSKYPAKLEVYNSHFTVKSKITGIKLSWDASSLGTGYRVLRDGEVLYVGTNTSYLDESVTPNKEYNYSLEVLVNGDYKEVVLLGKNSGYDIFETPNSIQFPNFTLGDSSSIQATQVDLEYVKYKDLSDVNTPYSLRVSSTPFASNDSSFSPVSFTLKDVKRLNNANEINKVYPDINLSLTPVELITTQDTSSDSYAKLEILKNNINLKIPLDLKLNSKNEETFTSTITWDLTYAP